MPAAEKLGEIAAAPRPLAPYPLAFHLGARRCCSLSRLRFVVRQRERAFVKRAARDAGFVGEQRHRVAQAVFVEQRPQPLLDLRFGCDRSCVRAARRQ